MFGELLRWVFFIEIFDSKLLKHKKPYPREQRCIDFATSQQMIFKSVNVIMDKIGDDPTFAVITSILIDNRKNAFNSCSL